MGDLMNDRSKMGGPVFQISGIPVPPAVKILLGEGKTDPINRPHARIDGLTVNLSLETAASVSFTIVNAYDSKTDFLPAAASWTSLRWAAPGKSGAWGR